MPRELGRFTNDDEDERTAETLADDGADAVAENMDEYEKREIYEQAAALEPVEFAPVREQEQYTEIRDPASPSYTETAWVPSATNMSMAAIGMAIVGKAVKDWHSSSVEVGDASGTGIDSFGEQAEGGTSDATSALEDSGWTMGESLDAPAEQAYELGEHEHTPEAAYEIGEMHETPAQGWELGGAPDRGFASTATQEAHTSYDRDAKHEVPDLADEPVPADEAPEAAQDLTRSEDASEDTPENAQQESPEAPEGRNEAHDEVPEDFNDVESDSGDNDVSGDGSDDEGGTDEGADGGIGESGVDEGGIGEGGEGCGTGDGGGGSGGDGGGSGGDGGGGGGGDGGGGGGGD